MIHLIVHWTHLVILRNRDVQWRNAPPSPTGSSRLPKAAAGRCIKDHSSTAGQTTFVQNRWTGGSHELGIVVNIESPGNLTECRGLSNAWCCPLGRSTGGLCHGVDALGSRHPCGNASRTALKLTRTLDSLSIETPRLISGVFSAASLTDRKRLGHNR